MLTLRLFCVIFFMLDEYAYFAITSRKFTEENIMKFLNPAEAAEILQVSVSSIHRWSRLGFIKSIRIGKQLRFTEEALRKFVDEDEAFDALMARWKSQKKAG